MQMNKATVLAILAFTTSALAQYEQYSYGSEIYAREAEPEFDDYSLYAREEYDEEFSQLSAREEAYLAGYMSGLQARQTAAQKDALNNLAAGENAQASKLNKAGDDQAHKAKHDEKMAQVDKAIVDGDKSKFASLMAEVKALEAKMTTDKKKYAERREKAEKEAKKSAALKGQAGALKKDAAALKARELLEEIYGFDFDY